MTLWRYSTDSNPPWSLWGWRRGDDGWWYRKTRCSDALSIADFGIDSRGRVVSTDLCERMEVRS